MVRCAWVLAVVVGLVTTAHADDPKPPATKPPAAPPPDDELLEFLGSVDQGDDDWIDYLAQTDPATVAKTPTKEGEKK
jgi:hypothetical protein